MPDSLPDIYPNTIGDEAAQDFAPLIDLYGDPSNALIVYLHALGNMLKQVDDIAGDGPNDEPGWSQIFDLQRAKTEWLPWMGQLTGYWVPIQPDDQTLEEYDANQRERIITRSAYRRGTVSLLEEIVAEQLLDPKRVVIDERYGGDPYAIRVSFYDDQIATSFDEIKAAALAEKMAGYTMIIDTIGTGTTSSYGVLSAENDTYAILHAKFTTYQDMHDHPDRPT